MWLITDNLWLIYWEVFFVFFTQDQVGLDSLFRLMNEMVIYKLHFGFTQLIFVYYKNFFVIYKCEKY